MGLTIKQKMERDIKVIETELDKLLEIVPKLSPEQRQELLDAQKPGGFHQWCGQVRAKLESLQNIISPRAGGIELCKCCGEGGRGLSDLHPDMWVGCLCVTISRCTDCSRCYRHCQCVTPEQRLEALANEDLLIRRSIDEAERLAAALGVDEIHGTMNEETMLEVEQLLKLRYKAFRRYTRRVYQLFQLQFDREMVERRIATNESDRPN